MKCLLLTLSVAAITAVGASPTALAQSRCVVSDPTGTPMNVRAHPNGPILGALHNGAAVQILDVTVDGGGRPWAYVVPLGEGRRGWVFRAHLACR